MAHIQLTIGYRLVDEESNPVAGCTAFGQKLVSLDRVFRKGRECEGFLEAGYNYVIFRQVDREFVKF